MIKKIRDDDKRKTESEGFLMNLPSLSNFCFLKIFTKKNGENHENEINKIQQQKKQIDTVK